MHSKSMRYAAIGSIILLSLSFSNPIFADSTKFNWEVCRYSDGHCQPSRACVATLPEAEALLKSGGFENTWYLTGEKAGICSAASSASSSGSQSGTVSRGQKFNWEVCRYSDGHCQPSRACVATLREAEALLRSGGFEDWWLTGEKSNSC